MPVPCRSSWRVQGPRDLGRTGPPLPAALPGRSVAHRLSVAAAGGWVPGARFGRGVRFAHDSTLEGDGFEPSVFRPEFSVSAALAASVAANLHPYNAPLCTPWPTDVINRAHCADLAHAI
jgi:hypothetical protein